MSSASQKPAEKPAEKANSSSGSEQLFPMHKKGDNLFDLLGLCDYYGVGFKAARKDWIERYPDSYWLISKVKMSERGKRAWGKLFWKGKVQYDGVDRMITSVNKREWSLLSFDAEAVKARPDKGKSCSAEMSLLEARSKARALLEAPKEKKEAEKEAA
jgi:hypothetical protein